jgi:hypothetical protein
MELGCLNLIIAGICEIEEVAQSFDDIVTYQVNARFRWKFNPLNMPQ